MTAARVAVDVVGVAAAVGMALNGARWFLRGIAAWYQLRDLLAETGEEPAWEPVQPKLAIGLWLLVHRPTTAGISDVERADVEGRVAIAWAWLWLGAGIATLALLILAQHV
jgi:hypothetical protein